MIAIRAILVGTAVVVAGGCSAAAPPGSDDPKLESPTASAAGSADAPPLLYFEGKVDVATQQMQVSFHKPGSDTLAPEAVLPEGPSSIVAHTVSTAWDGVSVFSGQVELVNHYGSSVTGLIAKIDATAPSLVTSDGPWTYGTVANGATSAAQTWRFTDVGGTGFSFIGHVEAGYRNTVLTEPGLLSYYTFENDSSGTGNVLDIGPANHKGTLQNAAVTTAGTGIGGSKGLHLPGVTDDYVALGTVSDFQFTGGTGTIEMWIQAGTTSPGGANPCFIANRAAGSISNTRYSFHLLNAFNGMVTWNGSSNHTYAYSTATTYHQVDMVMSGGNLTYYVDGVSEGTVGFLLGVTGLTTQIGTSLGSNEQFIGNIDEVSFYSTALSASTIAAHHAAFTTFGL